MKKLFALLVAALVAMPALAQTTIAPGGAIYDNATGSFIGFTNRKNGAEERLGAQGFLAPNGSAAAPSLGFTTETTTGFAHLGTARINAVISGTPSQTFFPLEFRIGSNGSLSWSSGNPESIASDTFLFRVAAGSVQLGNGSSVNGTIIYSPFAFASIGSVMSQNGQVGYCSDCTIANPCAGGGTGALVKRLNGINVCN